MNAPQMVLSGKVEESLYTVSTVSYVLHAIVAVGAVLPGSSPACCCWSPAVIIDMVMGDEAQRQLAGESLPLPVALGAPGRHRLCADPSAVVFCL
jgi:hypothetical protein